MSGLDFNNLSQHTTSELLQHVCELSMEHRRAVVVELMDRNEDREKFHTELQGANTELVYQRRALQEFMGNRVPEWVADVVVETNRAKRKHGDNDYTDFQRLCILTEEVGEVSNVLCRMYVPPISAGLNVPGEMQNLRAELIQVQSVAARWVEALDAKSQVGSQKSEADSRTICDCEVCQQRRAKRDAANETISPSNSPESFGLDPHAEQRPPLTPPQAGGNVNDSEA